MERSLSALKISSETLTIVYFRHQRINIRCSIRKQTIPASELAEGARACVALAAAAFVNYAYAEFNSCSVFPVLNYVYSFREIPCSSVANLLLVLISVATSL